MNDTAIRVENLGKMYRIGVAEERPRGFWQGARSLVASPFGYLRRMTRPPTEEEMLWALTDVSFEVKRGEVLGIIGRNGAGKSTLLKVLSRITEPTEGRAIINGRVGSLLEVGTGFHEELTGRENIYMNGAILGMKRTEIDRKFDEIVDFSGVERFLDTPVKRYSSGMYVRLAFAVAAHLEPEILLVDEVLAVGDAEFQRKCLGKMGEVAGEGRTVLLVSHNMAAIENLCSRAVLLDSGRVAAAGMTVDTISQYLAFFDARPSSRDLAHPSVRRAGTGEARFQSVEIQSLSGERTSSVAMGDGIKIRMEVLAFSEANGVEFAVGLYSAHGLRLCGFNSHDISALQLDLIAGQRVLVECAIPRINVSPGLYLLNLLIRKRDRESADLIEQAVSFEVMASDVFGTGRIPAGRNLIYLDAHWSATTAN